MRRAYIATAERFVVFWRIIAAGQSMRACSKSGTICAPTWLIAADFGLGNALAGVAATVWAAAVLLLRSVGGSNASVPQMRGPRVKGAAAPGQPAEAMEAMQDVEDNAREAWVGARDGLLLLLLYGADCASARRCRYRGSVAAGKRCA